LLSYHSYHSVFRVINGVHRTLPQSQAHGLLDNNYQYQADVDQEEMKSKSLSKERRSSIDEKTEPRWTIPKRTRMGGENLHVSSFLMIRNRPGDSIVLLRAGPKHPVQFKRGKLLLPATILNFGDSPRLVAQRLMSEQLDGPENLKVEFASMQSYLGAHWDIVFVFAAKVDEKEERLTLAPKEPFTEAAFHKLSNLPRDQIAEDHLEVLDQLRKEEESEQTSKS
jgi:hypothetical protein